MSSRVDVEDEVVMEVDPPQVEAEDNATVTNTTEKKEEAETDRSKPEEDITPEVKPEATPCAAAKPEEEAKPEAEVKTETKPGEDTKEEAKPEMSAEDTKQEKKPAEKEGPKNLDLAFAMDCTGSMGSYIDKARQSIRDIVEEIVSKESADIRLSLVEYRDHPPQDRSFVTRTNDFTESVRKMKKWLDGCSASGGGDGPEAVADALHDVLKLDWREESTKICVFIADAPPHGLGGGGDGFPNGCPIGLDPMQITNQLAEKGIIIYMIGCEPSISSCRDFYMALTHITGGQYVPLSHAKVLPKVIIGGAQEEISLEQLRQEVNRDVMAEINALGAEAEVDLDEVTMRVQSKMTSRGVKSKQLKMNKTSLPQATARAHEYSHCSDMSAIKSSRSKAGDDIPERMDYLGAPGGPRMRQSAVSKKRKSTKSGWFGRMFGAKKEETEEAESNEDLEEEENEGIAPTPRMNVGGDLLSMPPQLMACPPLTAGATPYSAPAPSFTAASSDPSSYDVVEEDLDYNQTSRMVHQAVFQNQMQARIKK